jgi:predicted phage terminase large subunit-like protein
MFHVKQFWPPGKEKGPLCFILDFVSKFAHVQNELTLMSIPDDVEADRLRLEYRLAQLESQDKARTHFIDFVRYVWPNAILGAHHEKVASAFDRIANGTLKRLIINMPPRHTKSEFASYLLPAYLMGRDPRTKAIEATHNSELAVRFGRKVRDLMDMDVYKEVFPEVSLKQDSKAAGRWDTNKGGEYFAVGVGGAMTGRGADILIIDDPHSEQDAQSDLALDNCWEWYSSGPRTRLQPGGAVVLVMTRWGTKDLTARLIKAQTSHNADKWEVIELPAILPSGKPLWPQFWKLEELNAVKASLSVQKWNAMYQQQPTNDEGAILKREWWRVWPHDDPPLVDYIIQTMDTAYSKKETADFSVIATWGIFYPDEDSGANIILLDVFKKRMDFPELKRVAKEQYEHWQPDNVLIEAKATGITLQQELRRMSIPVTLYSPGGRRTGTDKVSRANSVAPILEAGMVWAPDKDWAEELVEECAAFPNGDNDDMVDVTTMALMRFRQGNFVSLATDDVDEGTGTKDLVPEYY